MAWTIIGTGIDGGLDGKSFGVSLETDAKTWTAQGPDVSQFFTTRSGTYNIAGIPENGTQLVGSAVDEVAFFRALNGTSGVGDTGTGRASEKGVNFRWRLASK